MCDNANQAPTHDSDSLGKLFFWCKNCGLYLKMQDIDASYDTERTEKRLRRSQDPGRNSIGAKVK